MTKLGQQNPGYLNKVKGINLSKKTVPNVFSKEFISAPAPAPAPAPVQTKVPAQRQSARQANRAAAIATAVAQTPAYTHSSFNYLGQTNSPLIGKNFTNTYQKIQNNQQRRALQTQYQQQQQKYQKTPMFSAPSSPVLSNQYNTNNYGMNIDGGSRKRTQKRITRKLRKSVRHGQRKTRYSIKYV